VDVIAASHSLGLIRWWESPIADPAVHHDIAVGFEGVSSIDVGDVDGDGNADLAAVSETLDVARLWDNDSGMGTSFMERTIATDAIDARHVVLANIDGMDDLEIVVGTDSLEIGYGGITHYTYSGSSWVEARLDLQTIRGLSAGDVDGDGLDDLLACNGMIGMLFHNDGAGGFNRVLLDRRIGDCNAAVIADAGGTAPAKLLFSNAGTEYIPPIVRIWQDD
jgi:hypothetical protein